MQDTGFKAAVVSSVLVAGSTQFTSIEDLPKGWLVGAVLFLLGLVGFFAKRDYTRFNDSITAINLRLASVDKTLQDCVTFAGLGTSTKNIHGKINKVGQRLTVLESLLGMHGKIDLSKIDETDPDEPDESAG